MVQTIAATTTRAGLRVHAELDPGTYDTGIQVSDAQPGPGLAWLCHPALTGLPAAILHYRHALPQVAIADLFRVRPETVSKCLRDIRQILDQAGTAIQPGPRRLASLQDLYELARSSGIDILAQDHVSVLFSGKP